MNQAKNFFTSPGILNGIKCNCCFFVHFLVCVISAGQETAKQALQEIVILPAIRPEVRSDQDQIRLP